MEEVTRIQNLRAPTYRPGGDKAALRQSPSLLLSQFDSKTLLYPGPGTSFSLGEVDRRMVLDL